jgi:hypothetical protein
MGGTANHMADMWMLRGEGDMWRRQLDAPSDSVSVLDLKAAGAARHEYEKGLQFVAQNKLKPRIPSHDSLLRWGFASCVKSGRPFNRTEKC